jgi:hypothetical protein
MKYQLEPYNRNIPEEELLADLRKVATELRKDRVTQDEYDERGAFSGNTLVRRFGSWFKATDKAGLSRTRNYRIPNEDLFSNLVEVWTNLGRQPRREDLKPSVSRFSGSVYEQRFGTWRKALAEFIRWANEGKFAPEPDGNAKKAGRRTPRNINWRLRALVLMRDRARCRLCGAGPSEGATLHVDHVKPWSKGGETVLENMQILCNVCNIGKSDVEIETAS